ncbi:hypothetical protein T09_6081 [Trichinella sp. T9]|nr:hypothetical protein T09_6081 [Trichinella sp. T9]
MPTVGPGILQDLEYGEKLKVMENEKHTKSDLEYGKK